MPDKVKKSKKVKKNTIVCMIFDDAGKKTSKILFSYQNVSPDLVYTHAKFHNYNRFNTIISIFVFFSFLTIFPMQDNSEKEKACLKNGRVLLA